MPKRKEPASPAQLEGETEDALRRMEDVLTRLEGIAARIARAKGIDPRPALKLVQKDDDA